MKERPSMPSACCYVGIRRGVEVDVEEVKVLLMAGSGDGARCFNPTFSRVAWGKPEDSRGWPKRR